MQSNLLTRVSTPSVAIGPPGPDPQQLRALLQAALRVPDHARLQPWRLLLIEGDARAALTDFVLARRRELDADEDAATLAKEKRRFASPCIIAVVSCPVAGHKVPEIEQTLSGAALCMNILHAAHASGFAAQWLTGWPAYDDAVRDRLGLAAHERILGFLHLGTATQAVHDRPRPELDAHLRRWQP